MTFDAGNGVTVMYGGRRGSLIYADLWVYDYGANTWTELSPSNPPLGTRLGSIVYDSDLQQSVLYKGGAVFTLQLRSSPSPPPPPPAPEIVIDNARAGVSDASRAFTGTWCVSEATGQLGPDSLYSCQGGAHTYRWRPTIPATGQFDVYVRWTQHVNRSAAVPIAVTHAGGTTTRTFDERTGGGVWTLHGRYTFNAGTAGFVQVTDSAGQAAADGVRLVPLSP
jgi:hypothetical protein